MLQLLPYLFPATQAGVDGAGRAGKGPTPTR
jgi:hypothetical protein